MWAKWVGALFIVGAATVWGNQRASRLRQRVRQLEDFRLALRLLTAEIGYTATPLPRALFAVSSRLREQHVKMFFVHIVGLLREPGVTDATEAWLEAARIKKADMALVAEDWPVLLRVAAGLGGLGRESQMKQLEAAEAQLAAHTSEALSHCASGEKMWRYLGVMGGVALVILLL